MKKKNAIHNFLEPRMMSSIRLFCATNSPEPTDILQIPTFETLEPENV